MAEFKSRSIIMVSEDDFCVKIGKNLNTLDEAKNFIIEDRKKRTVVYHKNII